MWECGRDGFGSQEETSGISKDKTESILTAVEVLQPTLAPCLPQPPRRDCAGAGGEHAVLSTQHPAAAPTQRNTLREVRCKCCFLATGQPHKKPGLPVCMETTAISLLKKFM